MTRSLSFFSVAGVWIYLLYLRVPSDIFSPFGKNAHKCGFLSGALGLSECRMGIFFRFTYKRNNLRVPQEKATNRPWENCVMWVFPNRNSFSIFRFGKSLTQTRRVICFTNLYLSFAKSTILRVFYEYNAFFGSLNRSMVFEFTFFVSAHINHIKNVAGIDSVGLGAGYDGINL